MVFCSLCDPFQYHNTGDESFEPIIVANRKYGHTQEPQVKH